MLVASTKVKEFENTHEIVCESRTLYGVEIWGVRKGWETADETQRRPGEAQEHSKENSERKLGIESAKGKMLGRTVKYWNRTSLMERDKLLKCCYEWQIGNPQCDSSARNLRGKLYKIRLGYMWLDIEGGI
jgi:hypothetical protein